MVCVCAYSRKDVIREGLERDIREGHFVFPSRTQTQVLQEAQHTNTDDEHEEVHTFMRIVLAYLASFTLSPLLFLPYLSLAWLGNLN